jgi:hypothetical protein
MLRIGTRTFHPQTSYLKHHLNHQPGGTRPGEFTFHLSVNYKVIELIMLSQFIPKILHLSTTYHSQVEEWQNKNQKHTNIVPSLQDCIKD